jgi:hypothetical protein
MKFIRVFVIELLAQHKQGWQWIGEVVMSGLSHDPKCALLRSVEDQNHLERNTHVSNPLSQSSSLRILDRGQSARQCSLWHPHSAGVHPQHRGWFVYIRATRTRQHASFGSVRRSYSDNLRVSATCGWDFWSSSANSVWVQFS